MGVRPYAHDNDPLNIGKETNGHVLVKFYFQNPAGMPEGIPKREDGQVFQTNRAGVRKDSGTKALDAWNVGAEFLRTGLANADGHQWKLVNICWWNQPVTNEAMRAKYGDTQCVVQLAYRSNPKEDEVPTYPRLVLDAVRILSRCASWHVVVWHNDFGPATVNFTSPSEEAPVQQYLAVRDGCLVLIPASDVIVVSSPAKIVS